MNDKIKQLLENAEQSDAIAKNKWRIENREQLRKERKEKLKELMEKDKQQTAVEWLWEIAYNRELTVEDWKQAKEMEKQQRSIKLPSYEDIWKWWKTQKFQKEQGEQEYTMLYEIDLPKILKAFIEHFNKIQGGDQ
jgi:hypothetical protein